MSEFQQTTEQQEASVRQLAEALRTAYASFPTPDLKPYAPSTWLQLKGILSAPFFGAPDHFDWRNHVAVPPAKFQGLCNSCTSFATAAAIEIQLLANGAGPLDVAAWHMHTCTVHGASPDLDHICAYGIEPSVLLQALTEFGYAINQSDEEPFPPFSCASVPYHDTLRGFTAVAHAAARPMLTRGPIVTDMYIWDDFFDYTTARAPVYAPDMSMPGPRLHTVCVVGYSDAGLVIKNSFGLGWGDGTGFATISAGTCGLLTNPPPGYAARPAFSVQV
jgi:hypothetical protein